MLWDNLPLRKLMAERMQWLGQRQVVLAQNIANADTPNYRPQDLKPMKMDFASHLNQVATPHVALAVDSPGQMQGTAPQNDGAHPEKAPSVYETSPDGNSVVLSEQMLKMNQTQIDYQTTTNLYKQYNAMIRIALGPGA